MQKHLSKVINQRHLVLFRVVFYRLLYFNKQELNRLVPSFVYNRVVDFSYSFIYPITAMCCLIIINIGYKDFSFFTRFSKIGRFFIE